MRRRGRKGRGGEGWYEDDDSDGNQGGEGYYEDEDENENVESERNVRSDPTLDWWP